jgi:glycosyltransferase involved in cell wall biosynthesis
LKTGKPIYINGRFTTKPITGVERYCHELVMAMDRLLDRGNMPQAIGPFVLLVPPNAPNIPQLRHIEVRTRGRLRGHAWEQFDLPVAARGGLLFCPGNTAPVASLVMGKANVVTVHDLSYRYFPQAYSRAFRVSYSILMPLVFALADRVITVSESERSSLRKCYPAASRRVVAVQNGGIPGDRHIASGRQQRPPGPMKLLYVGSLSRRKNFHGFLEAARLLRGTLEFDATVVGGAGKIFQSTRVNAPEGVQFLGQVDDPQTLFECYRDAHCLVFPSFYEASPLPPLEAMTFGCPVIASSIPSLLERCGDAALYCDPNDPRDIAQKVRRLASDGALWAELSRRGVERAARFSWEACARRTCDILEDVAFGRVPAS